jgi:hypothetical protein
MSGILVVIRRALREPVVRKHRGFLFLIARKVLTIDGHKRNIQHVDRGKRCAVAGDDKSRSLRDDDRFAPRGANDFRVKLLFRRRMPLRILRVRGERSRIR